MGWKGFVFRNLFIALLLVGKTSFAAAENTTSSETNLLLPPPKGSGDKIPVSLAFRLLNLSNINEEEQHFNAVGYLVAVWDDPRLAYVQQNDRDVYRVYKKDQVWIPQFDFSNGVTPHQSHDSSIRVYPNGVVKYFERSSAELSNNLYLRKFPFDSQILKIQIQPFVGQETQVVFSVGSLEHLNEFTTQQSLSAQNGAYASLAQWTVMGTNASVQSVKGLGSNDTSVVSFQIELKRRTAFYILKVFLPLLMMVIISWMAFWIDPKELKSQVQITATTILTVIAFSFAIAANIPRVPYLTFIDSIFLTCYIFVFGTTLAVTRIHVYRWRELEESKRQLQRRCQFSFPILFCVSVLILILYFGLFSA